MSKQPSRNHPETCGTPALKLDTFADVRRALDAYLLRTNPTYRQIVEDARARRERIKAGVGFDK